MDQQQQEQQNETEQNADATQLSNGVSRDELIAAVKAAGGTESVDLQAEERAAVERAADGEQQQATEGQQQTEEEPRIAAILRAREKAAQEREAARNQAEELIARAREESERMIREARERADRDWQEELARRRQAFAASPTEAIRALGDPQQIVDAVLKDGTPEGRALQQLQRELAETKQKAAVAEDVRKELADFRTAQQQQQFEAQIAAIRKEYFTTSATKEAAPYLHARYTEDQIFAEANELATRWRKGGMELHRDFDYNDVTQYLELESKKRLAPLLGPPPAQQVSAGAPAKEPGNAPKVLANGPRTLSAAQGSERRTSPKHLSEMKPDEQRAALIEEVAAARRANPNAEF